jgi:methyl-accepting chemotaxis protein-1 (serine sensor receptor)
MFRNVSIKAKLIGVIAFLAIQLIVGGVIGIVSLKGANEGMQSMYDQRLLAFSQVDKVARHALRTELTLAKALTAGQDNLPKVLAGLTEQLAQKDKEWAGYMAMGLSPDEKRIADEFAKEHKRYMEEGVMPAIAALRGLDMQTAVGIVHGPMNKLFAPMRVDRADVHVPTGPGEE